MIPDPKQTPVAPKTLTPSRPAHTIRVRVPRALETPTLTLANTIAPAGCKGLWGYGVGLGSGITLNLFFMINLSNTRYDHSLASSSFSGEFVTSRARVAQNSFFRDS